jgi:hypothetical protein
MRKFTACSTSPKYLSKRRAYLFLLVFASRDQTSASVRRLLPSSVKSMQSFSALQKIHVCRVSNLVSLTLPITRRRSHLYHNRTTFVGRRAWAFMAGQPHTKVHISTRLNLTPLTEKILNKAGLMRILFLTLVSEEFQFH